MSSPVSGSHWPPDPLSVLSPPSLRRQAWRHQSPLRKSAGFFPVPVAQPVRGVAAAHLDLRVGLAPEWPGKGTFQPRIERVFLPPSLSESRLSILSLEKGLGFLGGNKRAYAKPHSGTFSGRPTRHQTKLSRSELVEILTSLPRTQLGTTVPPIPCPDGLAKSSSCAFPATP